MELPLVGEAQAGPGVKGGQRRPLDALDTRQSRAMGGLQLAVQDVRWLTRRDKEITIETGEVAVDRLVPGDLLDAVDGRGVTVGRQPR